MSSNSAAHPDGYRVIGFSVMGPPPLDVVHVPWKPGLSVFYGKNGAGKTRLLQGLRAVFEGRASEPSSSAWLHLELIDEDGRFFHDIVEAVNQGAQEEFDIDFTHGFTYDNSMLRQLVGSIRGDLDLTTLIDISLRNSWLDHLPLFEDLAVEMVRCPLVSLQVDSHDSTIWKLHFSVRADDNLSAVGRLLAATSDHTSLGDLDDSAHAALEIVDGQSEHFLQPDRPGWVPVPLTYVGPIGEGASLPALIFDDTDALELWERSVRRDLSNNIERGDDGWFRVDPRLALTLDGLSSRSTELLQSFLDGGPALFVESRAPHEWFGGKLFRWLAMDSRSDELVPIDGLSTAERRWAVLSVMFAIAETAYANQETVMLIDEPERALHAGAVRRIVAELQLLAEDRAMPILVASHSPEFLNAPGAMLFHVERTESGKTTVAPLDSVLRDGLRATADRLGLAPSDVLQLVRAFLVVEGMHDVAVLEELIGPELAELRVELLPMHGANSLNSTLDARLIFDFTDARMIALLDHVRTERLRDVWDRAVAVPDRRRAANMMGHFVESGMTKEERLLGEFCLQALRSRKQGRVDFFALAEPDIIFYLPVERLVPGATSWAELDVEWQGLRHPRPKFKHWLHSRGGKISVRTIRDAAKSMDHVPGVFTELLSRLSG